MLAKPPAIVPIGVVIGAIHPDPDSVPKYAVTIIEAVMVVVVVVALSEASIAVAMVAVAMVAVTIEGLSIPTTHITFRT